MSAFSSAFRRAFDKSWASAWGVIDQITQLFTPASLFPSGQQGGQQGRWGEPSDTATEFQESSGATPVTASGQFVGLMLDKRLGLARGAELVTNGTFGTDTAGWTPSLSATLSVVAGALRVANNTGAAANAFASFEMATVIGLTYVIAGTFVANSGAVPLVRFSVGDSAGTQNKGFADPSIGAVPPFYFVATTTSHVVSLIGFSAPPGSYLDWDNISVQSVAGNHASQATSAARPVYTLASSLHYNVLDGIDDCMEAISGGGGTAGFFFCQAVKILGGAGAARTVWSDAGTNSGYKVQINASNQLQLSAGNGTAYTSIATAGATVINTTHLLTVWDDGTNLNVQLDSGAVATVARPVVTAGTAGFTIGKDNGAATGYLNAHLYSDIYRQGSGLTATERANAQAYVRSKAGL